MPDAIQLRGISKSFGGVVALADVTLTIDAGECHALVGENGAGKSTLGRILAGILRPDRGEIRIGDRPVHFRSPSDALSCGIGMVHQELAFCPDLSVAENLLLGRYPRYGPFLRRGAMERQADDMLAEIGVRLDVRTPIRRLSTAQEQLVQIVAAVGVGARLLILDEPTSSLTQAESVRLFELLATLRARSVTTVYVSHRLPEVLKLADRITVLRDGRLVGTLPRRDATERDLVQMMIGRPLPPRRERAATPPDGPPMLEVESLSSPGRFDGISLTVRPGEIVGLAGLVGAGRSELATALFGLDPQARGLVRVAQRTVPPGCPAVAMQRGMGLVPEDRKRHGLILGMSCLANASLATLDHLNRFGFLARTRERTQAAGLFQQVDVRTPSLDTPVGRLSGGNQQKVALAKWLARDLKVLIVDEPTRGVDVGAKAVIHDLLESLAQRGLAILLISSELPELLRLSHRILVLRQGRLVAEVPRHDATQERLLRLMSAVA